MFIYETFSALEEWWIMPIQKGNSVYQQLGLKEKKSKRFCLTLFQLPERIKAQVIIFSTDSNTSRWKNQKEKESPICFPTSSSP